MSTVRVGIVDYGMGNLTSVNNALQALDIRSDILHTPRDLQRVSHIILPGVGAFGEAMRNLNNGEWVGPLNAAVLEQGKPLLGICLGLQLLATASEEFGEHQGLSWIPGRVVRLKPESSDLRVPHIGWNDVTQRVDSPLYSEVPDHADFYFVHSFHLVPDDTFHLTGVCEYGVTVTASVERGHIFATQFHPEKSGRAGLQILLNFSRVMAD